MASGSEELHVSHHPLGPCAGPVLSYSLSPPREHSSRRKCVTPMSLFIFITENICTAAEFDF